MLAVVNAFHVKLKQLEVSVFQERTAGPDAESLCSHCCLFFISGDEMKV